MANSAVRRLMRDLKELNSEPFDTISATPLQNNLMEWHCNLRPPSGPYEGAVFHLILKFPRDYPLSPPEVNLCTSLPHPNVFAWGDEYPYICLDMLQQSSSTTPYEGWSSAYSVASILLQLQSFFFEENAIPQDYGGARRNTALSPHIVNATKQRAANFHCGRCGHGGSRSPYPSLSKGWKRPQPTGGRMVAGSIWQVDSMWEEATGQWCGFRHPQILTRGRSVFEVTVKREGYGASRGALQVGCTTGNNDHWLRLCSSTLGATAAAGQKKDKRRAVTAGRISAGDTITCAVDFEAEVVHFAMNGKVVGQPLPLPEGMRSGRAVHAAVNMRSTRVACNWSGPWRYPMEEFAHLLVDPAAPARPSTGEEKEEKEEKVSAPVVVAPVVVLPKLLLWAGGRARAFDKPVEQLQGLAAQQHDGYPLPEVLLLEIFEFLSSVELARLPQVCVGWARLVTSCQLPQRRQLRCFHSKASYTETVLGVGLCVERHRDGALKSVTSPMDLLSYPAFSEERVRLGVWKERFQHFLPLVLSPDHARRALPVLQKCLGELLGKAFQPVLALEVVTCLMNSTVVALMKDSEDHLPTAAGGAATRTLLHASERALQAYCAFHHLLLHLAEQYPAIGAEADRRVSAFLDHPAARHKRCTPDLGRLLVCMVLSKRGWAEGRFWFLREAFTRNVRWLLQAHPELETRGGAKVCLPRLRKTFAATRTSCRLIMFQVHFLTRIGRPGDCSPAQVLASYRDSLGRPSLAAQAELQGTCKAILKVDYWPQFFQCCQVPAPSQAAMTAMLRDSLRLSARNGYHRAARGLLPGQREQHSRNHTAGGGAGFRRRQSGTAAGSGRRR